MTVILLVFLALLIKIFSYFPDAVEKYYAQGFYPFISRILRILLGWIPFSAGDLLYGALIIWIIVKFISLLRKFAAGRIKAAYASWLGMSILNSLLFVYIVFNLLWGLNYDRKGIAEQMQLEIRPYSTEELQQLVKLVVDHLNENDSAAHENRMGLKKKSQLFHEAIQAYQNRKAIDHFLQYQSPSVKPSMYSLMGNYFGFTGYYNPFSGEAQVNTTVPLFIQPFTTCHEIGHQLGYAKENEANFAGYLSAMASGNPSFRYSASLELYIYAASELYLRDSTLVKALREKLNPGIKEDFAALRAYLKKYENPLEPYIRRLYGRYLKANRQPQGLKTYDEVTAWIIAYYKKYGKDGS